MGSGVAPDDRRGHPRGVGLSRRGCAMRGSRVALVAHSAASASRAATSRLRACNGEPSTPSSRGRRCRRAGSRSSRRGSIGCAGLPRHSRHSHAKGVVGPPLAGMARRGFIAGQLPNKPGVMVAFLQNPPALVPHDRHAECRAHPRGGAAYRGLSLHAGAARCAVIGAAPALARLVAAVGLRRAAIGARSRGSLRRVDPPARASSCMSARRSSRCS